MCRGWQTVNNYNTARNGRIWVCWNPRYVKIDVIAENEQALHCKMVDVRKGIEQQFMAVYALNTNEQRKQLWRFIKDRCDNNMEPLVIRGDFNTVLCAADRFQGNPVSEGDVYDFAECIRENDLHEVRAVGCKFTWSNNQEGSNRIYSNIDRCLANGAWMNMFHQVVVERVERGVFDHCPQILWFEDRIGNRKTPFRFLNVFAEHEDFEQILKDGWRAPAQPNLLLGIWFRCKKLKGAFKQLNTKVFLKTSEKVGEIRMALAEIQRKMEDDRRNSMLITEERRLMCDLEKWSIIEEKIWQQKARVDWLKLGDSNIKFYHAYVKARQNTNAIQVLYKNDGTKCSTQRQIMEELEGFYMQLMGNAAGELPMVDKQIVDRGPKLSHDQQVRLCEM